MNCTPTLAAYGGNGARALCSHAAGHSLPFTGLSLLQYVVGAALLVLFGAALYRWASGAPEA